MPGTRSRRGARVSVQDRPAVVLIVRPNIIPAADGEWPRERWQREPGSVLQPESSQQRPDPENTQHYQDSEGCEYSDGLAAFSTCEAAGMRECP